MDGESWPRGQVGQTRSQLRGKAPHGGPYTRLLILGVACYGSAFIWSRSSLLRAFCGSGSSFFTKYPVPKDPWSLKIAPREQKMYLIFGPNKKNFSDALSRLDPDPNTDQRVHMAISMRIRPDPWHCLGQKQPRVEKVHHSVLQQKRQVPLESNSYDCNYKDRSYRRRKRHGHCHPTS